MSTLKFKPIFDTLQASSTVAEAAVFKHGARAMSDAASDTKEFRFHCFVGIFLSPMSHDKITHEAVMSLKALPSGLTPQSIVDMDLDVLKSKLTKVNHHKSKAENLKTACARLLSEFDGDVPSEVPVLQTFKGIGPKIALLVSEVCWNKSVGIVVDTHVHRICNKIGWVKTKDPEGTRKAMEALVDSSEHVLVNECLVALGQTICKAAKPDCANCPIREMVDCAFGKTGTPSSISSKKETPAKTPANPEAKPKAPKRRAPKRQHVSVSGD
uniref:ENDO3c domain-containing protein n=1 Tax=Panagrellus redivivus TaxID=6233 RepID=A0A7E4VNG1_PANRE